MAPVLKVTGVALFERARPAAGILPAVLLVVLLLGGFTPPAASGHAIAPSASGTHASPGDRLLAEAQASLDRSAPVASAGSPQAGPHPAAGATPRWTDLQSKVGNQVPAYRYLGTMAYDPIDQYVVLFGGFGNGSNAPYSDTWTYADGHWNNLGSTGPGARYAAMMTWDGGDGYVLLYGGYDSSTGTIYNDTWTFLHGTWTSLSPTNVPTARWRGAMAYDAGDNYTVLFGGTPSTATTSPMKDTWEFSAGQWANITTLVSGNPAARFRQDMTYDAADGYLVMFGGCTLSACSSQDTVTYHNRTWTLLSPATKPSARAYTGLSYDDALGEVVMMGGVSEATNSGFSDTWLFSNGTWTSFTSSPTSPSTRALEMITFDAYDGYTLLFGGQNPSTAIYLNDTWAFGPSVIAHVTLSPATIDLGQSTTLNATPFAYSGNVTFNYTGLPPGCTGASVASLSCTPTATGSFGISVVINDSNGLPTTKNVTLTVNPDVTITSAVAQPDTVTVGTRLHINVTAANGTTPYSFVYTGLPAGCGTGNTASLGCTPNTAGSYTVTVTLTDAVGWPAVAHVTVTVNPSPSLTGLVASPATIDLGQSFHLWANASGGTPPLSWTYTGLPVGCSTVNGPTLTCTPTAIGPFAIAVNVSDAFGWQVTGLTTVTVNSAPAITGFAVSPANIDLGHLVTFWLNGTGGTGVLTRNYVGLPPGCSLGRLDTGSCTPTSNGTFTITGSVTDVAGVTASQTITLTVVPDPVVESVLVNPLRVDAGQLVTINVTLSGGTAPIVFAYTGLPTGCLNATTALVTCHPVTSGVYSIVAQATDAWHMTSQLAASLTVNAAPSISQFTATVSPVTVGSTTILQTSVSGGSGVYSYVYSNLPTGCTTANKSSLPCTATVTGTFNVTVTVTDSAGKSVSASTAFVVQAAPTSSGFLGFSGSTGYLVIGLVVVVIVVVLAAALLMMRRRRGKSSEAPAEAWEEPAPEEPSGEPPAA